MLIWRLSKNGDTKPDFVCEQNPAACESKWHLRFFHYSYLWSFNFWLMLYPNWLSPDWSGESLPLMNEYWATDPRFGVVLATWVVMLAVVIHTIRSVVFGFTGSINVGIGDCMNIFSVEERRRVILTYFYWMFIPFILSSNLLVHVGFVVADRTLYLPSFGFCLFLLEVILYVPSLLLHEINDPRLKTTRPSKALITLSALFVLIMYTVKQQFQTNRWSHPVLIWEEAYRLNPNSIISGTGKIV